MRKKRSWDLIKWKASYISKKKKKKSERGKNILVVLSTNYGQEVSLVLLNLRQLLIGSVLCYFPILSSLLYKSLPFKQNIKIFIGPL